MHEISKSLVKKVLINPYDYNWSLQGLGMLRLYLSDTLRLHIWDEDFAVENVSLIHDHPWDFTSYIIAGCIRQFRFDETSNGALYNVQTIQCGEGGRRKGEVSQTRLTARDIECYGGGEFYEQEAEEIHQSMPERGTVTVIERTFKKDTEHARVFWDVNKNWVSVEPRPANPHEIHAITSYALKKWFLDK